MNSSVKKCAIIGGLWGALSLAAFIPLVSSFNPEDNLLVALPVIIISIPAFFSFFTITHVPENFWPDYDTGMILFIFYLSPVIAGILICMAFRFLPAKFKKFK